MKHHWQLRDDLDFLNHGSFGATPRCVLDRQRIYRDALEQDPIAFLAPERELIPKLDQVRDRLAECVHASPANLAFVRNATDGVNAVVRSFPWTPNDEVVITQHGYNACNNAVRFAAERAGAIVRQAIVPFPIADPQQVCDAIEVACTEKTRLLVVDHVTSATGLVFPIDQIIRNAHQRGIRVLVDGAHAPGMVGVNLNELSADYYTGNHHKWLCAPKASGFLYVDPRWQESVRATVISHAENTLSTDRSAFLTRFDWVGTYDPTPLLCVSDAIEFLSSLHPGGLPELMSRNRQLALQSQTLLCDALKINTPAPTEMIGSLVTLPFNLESIPSEYHAPTMLQSWLYQQHHFELPIFQSVSANGVLMRLSLQAYNSLDQVARLADVLTSMRST